MDSLLISEWLGDLTAIPILDAASVSLVRQELRARAAALQLSEVVTGSLLNVASELGQNQLAHGRSGSIAIRDVSRAGTPGLEIVAADSGRGIADPTRALHAPARLSDDSGPPPAKASLGIGLSAVLELADETDFDVRLGEGTCVWARKFARPVSRQREVGIFGRPYPGEAVSGDHACFARDEDSLLVGLADGLGHGPFARAAADLAVAALREQRLASLDRALESCHTALARSRGAVLATARLYEPQGSVEVASAGNVATRLVGPQLSRRVSGPSFVLGSPGAMRKVPVESHTLGPYDALLLFSDGLLSRFELNGELDLLREHPIVIAHQLVVRYARGNDDALVLVVR